MAKQETWTADQFRAHHSKKTGAKAAGARAKYKNERTQVDGFWFDSLKEAEYYGKLKLLKRAGVLSKFEKQVNYPLMVNGHKICVYRADFVLYYPDGSVVVVDVKSEATVNISTFKLKKALMWAIHKIKVQIV